MLTTHLRGLFDPYSHKTIIFDEDPINSLISIKKFELSDLFAIKNHEENKEDISQIIDIIEKTLKQYAECYTIVKEAKHENLEHFTAENFLKAVHMAISENMANEGPDRKKPRV